MIYNVVTTDVIGIVQKYGQFFLGATVIDSTIITQSSYVVNPMVAHADFNIHNSPVMTIASIFHAKSPIISYLKSISPNGSVIRRLNGLFS